MHIFSYVITHDGGFAPNPFGDFLTLATCKPRIREQARSGDIIVGTGSATTVGNHRMVYAAVIDDVITLEEYGALPKYSLKRPSSNGEWWRKLGDNIYFKEGGEWKQRQNPHHCGDHVDRDLSGKNVLVCNRFWYFGEDAIEIPEHLREIIKKGPGHKRITDESLVASFVEWLNTLPSGRHGNPEMCDDMPSHCSQPLSRVVC